jgi:hypothetical protein
VHGNQRDNLDGFAGAGGLLDENMLAGAADVRYQADLVATQLLHGGFHPGIPTILRKVDKNLPSMISIMPR